MRRMFWLLPLFFWYGLTAQTTQQSFVIIHTGSVTNISSYVEALNRNDLDKYRHYDQRVIMYFTEGVEVELLSGVEMVALGLPVDMNKVNKSEIDRLRNSQFTLHPSGRIIELVTPIKKGQ